MNKCLNTKLIWIPSIILLCISILLSIVLGIMITILPFPERFTIAELDKEMIKNGEGSLLIMIYFTLCFIGCSFFITFALAIVAFKKIFLTNCFFEYINKSKIYILFIIIFFFYICISLIFILGILYYFVNYQKFLNKQNNNLDETYKKIKFTKKYKNQLLATVILASCVIILTPTITIIASVINKQIKINKIPNRYDDIQQIYTLSSNQPNTMILYFDRGLGFLYNLLIMVDYSLFGENSLIVKYPEFTSYINVLSNSTLTVGSNPSINGSWFMLPKFKNNNQINPFTNIPNDQMDMNNWFLTAYTESMKLFQYYGYENLGIYNAPYYGNKTYHNQENSQELQTDLTNVLKSTTNIKVLDSSEIVKTLEMNPNLSRTDDTKVLQNFASHSNEKPLANNNIINNVNYGKNKPMQLGKNNKILNLSVSHTKQRSSTLLFNHFHITHETYTYVKDSQSVSLTNAYGINNLNPSIGKAIDIGNDVNGLLVSIWYSIQKIKNIFDYLKNLPYDGPNSNIIQNQYDNTNIYVIADHGYTVFQDSSILHQVLDYLNAQHFITSEQIEYLLNEFMNDSQTVYGANPVFMVKQRKYVHPHWNKKIDKTNYVQNFFNLDKILSLADLMPIIDSNLQKDIKDKDSNIVDFKFAPNESWYNSEQLKKWSQENTVDDLIKINFLLDPLNQDLTKLKNRKIPIYGVEWHFVPKNYLYKIYLSKLFDCSKANNTIFTNNCLINDD